jgi:polyisoprenoid-binding protein YceI
MITKKNGIVLAAFILAATLTQAQDKYFTKSGKIEFYSKAPLEDIEAKNKTAQVVLDTKTGALQFSVLMKGFEFQKALMQEHFNENYVESDKFPKADFKGTVVNNNAINYTKSGTYNAKVKGQLTMHGITKDVEASGTVKVDGGELKTASTFNVQLSDYGIKIPAIVKDKISNTVKIVVDCKLDPLK